MDQALFPTQACHSHLGSAGGKRALRRWTKLLSPLFYSPASNRKGAVSLGEVAVIVVVVVDVVVVVGVVVVVAVAVVLLWWSLLLWFWLW